MACGVYFVSCKEYDLVKIGISADVHKRVWSIQSHSPAMIQLIGYISSESLSHARNLEASYHREFASIRRHGEWFYKPDLANLLPLMTGDDGLNARLSRMYSNPSKYRDEVYETRITAGPTSTKYKRMMRVYDHLRASRPTGLNSLCEALAIYPSQLQPLLIEMIDMDMITKQQDGSNDAVYSAAV